MVIILCVKQITSIHFGQLIRLSDPIDHGISNDENSMVETRFDKQIGTMSALTMTGLCEGRLPVKTVCLYHPWLSFQNAQIVSILSFRRFVP
jgi:hypothetical protein